MRLAPLLAAAALAAACSARRDERSREAVFAAPSARAGPPRPFDFAHPEQALRMDADEVAARAGSFSWEGEVSWIATRGARSLAAATPPPSTPPSTSTPGDLSARPPPAPPHTTERHRLRQLATGEFEVACEIDPGLGPGSEEGRQVIFARGMTYARGRWAPWRERPTDRGRDARRQRDDGFRLAGALADLLGPALSIQPAGEVTALGREARRFVLSLSGALPADEPAPPGLPAGGPDPDTRRRLQFLGGRIPTVLSGELLLDAASGVPLAVQLTAVFTERADPQLRVEVAVVTRTTALGASVARVGPPAGALADERKPKGVARALEAAGLRRRAGAPGEADEGEPEPADDEAAPR